jgi:hypothetical protein
MNNSTCGVHLCADYANLNENPAKPLKVGLQAYYNTLSEGGLCNIFLGGKMKKINAMINFLNIPKSISLLYDHKLVVNSTLDNVRLRNCHPVIPPCGPLCRNCP